MNRLKVLIVLLFAVITGCTSAGPEPQPAPLGGDPVFTEVVPEPDTSDLGQIQAGVDSAAALFDFGDIRDFLVARDSLRHRLDRMIKEYPIIRYDPEFAQILRSLDGLDTLRVLQNYSHDYLVEIDSLALANENWPELDSTQTEMVTSGAVGDSVFPYMENERIAFWLRYFMGPGKERFERALYRMQLYRPVIEEIIDEMGLPQDLICVPLIESGFVLKARSRARAVGPWQFIAGTGRIYGLRVNWWYDERRDIVASTYAACNYFDDLFNIWESWPLALASYNCGEYRVARAVARQNTTNFWELRLPKQTERYVPKFLAALYILRDPGDYGFTVPDVEPVKFDEVTVKDATDLKLIAQSAGSSVDVLQDLNPSLLRWCTPPKMELSVKVPLGSGQICSEKLAAVPPSERVTWRKHKIRPGESLSTIARRYQTSTGALKELNGIRNANRIRAGRYLIVPVHGSFNEAASAPPAYRGKRRNLSKEDLEKYAKRYAPPPNSKEVIYLVKDGDTLGEIAEVYHTRASRIRGWNNLSYRSYIYPGQKLVIYVPESFEIAETTQQVQSTPNENEYVKRTYTVKKGDSFYSISRRFDIPLVDLLSWNGKSANSTLYPGQTLFIWQKK